MKRVVAIIILMMTFIFLIVGCTKNDNINISDLEGYWGDEYIYINNEGMDKVIQFTDDEKMIVYSYYDKGTTIYKYTVLESTKNKIIIALDKNDETIELERISDDKYMYKVDDEKLYIVRINNDEANKFIDIIEQYVEY